MIGRRSAGLWNDGRSDNDRPKSFLEDSFVAFYCRHVNPSISQQVQQVTQQQVQQAAGSRRNEVARAARHYPNRRTAVSRTIVQQQEGHVPTP